MSAYAYNTLTQAGATLIAQATAANPIVFVASKSKASAATDADDLASKTLSWYDGKSGTIAACSAYVDDDGNPIARIIAAYTNSGSTQIAKSVCITARLASQTDADAVVFAAISDPDATIELPGSGSIASLVEFPFNISINATNTVTVTPGSSASVADLERFVSIHSAGNPNVGDSQTIRGKKTFTDNVLCNGSVSCGNVSCGDIDCGVIDAGDDIYANNGNVTAIAFIADGDISAGNNISAMGNLEIHGSAEFMDGVEISTGDLKILNGSVVASTDVECDSVICTSRVTVGAGQNRIKADASTGKLSARILDGILPYPDAAGHEPPIGGYALIAVTQSASFDVAIGQTFDGSVDTIQTACYFTESATGPHYGVKQGYTTLHGTYVACADAYSGTDHTCYFIAQRIS